MKKKEFEFKLESPIIYQCPPAGEKETDLLLFKAPTVMQKDAVDVLRKALVGGIMKAGTQFGGEQNKKKNDGGKSEKDNS